MELYITDLQAYNEGHLVGHREGRIMAIKLISYTKKQRAGMAVTGYSLYINENFYCIYETLNSVYRELQKYSLSTGVEIYPVLKRRY